VWRHFGVSSGFGAERLPCGDTLVFLMGFGAERLPRGDTLVFLLVSALSDCRVATLWCFFWLLT
jgi:hypothetical protein